MSRALLAAMLLGLTIPSSIGAQEIPREPLPESAVFEALQQGIEAVPDWAERSGLHVQTLVFGMQEDAMYIEDRWPERREGDPIPYLWSLTYNAYLLEEAVAELTGLTRGIQNVQAVAEDLQAKADDARRNEGLIVPSVMVRVHTFVDGVPRPGYEVWYVERGMYGRVPAYKRFDRFSTPTNDQSLAPGGYYFWVRMADSEYRRTFNRVVARDGSVVEIDLAAERMGGR